MTKVDAEFFHLLLITSVACLILGLTGCTTSKAKNTEDNGSPSTETTTQTLLTPVPAALSTPISNAVSATTATPPATANPLCDWIDTSDVILQLSFAEGTVPDSSYSAGFSYDRGTSYGDHYLGRLARKSCDYRVGFTLSETADIKAATVRVMGNSYNEKVVLDPLSATNILFDGGLPVAGKTVLVRVTDIQNQGK